MVALSIIVVTKGRDTLARTVASVLPQLEHGDELLIKRADTDKGRNSGPEQAAVRNLALEQALGTHVLYIDDDDSYTPGALAIVRRAARAEPYRVHVFAMVYPDGRIVPEQHLVRPGMLGTPNVVTPNDFRRGRWPGHRLGDYEFAASTLARHDQPPVWHEEIIVTVRA